MGFLTNTKRRGKIRTFLLTQGNKLCLLSFVIGLVWFCMLAWEPCNNRTYFSENALLPGFVHREFSLGSVAGQLFESLKDEAKSRSGLPYAWLQGHFRQLGLEVYVHNFTLQYPFGSKARHTGKNLYAILRAPKTASTEALVLSTPYRGLDSIHDTTLPGIALMLALAQSFRRHTYWSKDIIFLITEHEMIGFQAWLDAYHDTYTSPDILHSGHLSGRSGAIQAAINIEIEAEKISHVDIKIAGLNGQLPNLDLFNLAVELCTRESVPTTFQSQLNPIDSYTFKGWMHSFSTMMSMVGTQAAGLPSGGHGLFHRYAIQSITLKGKVEGVVSPRVSYSQMGWVLEGIFRSLNNLLEKFHQSFFFYLLPTTRRYVSIGLYMPPFCLMAAPILIKALCLYLSFQSLPENVEISKDPLIELSSNNGPSLWSAIHLIALSHVFGYLVFFSPQLLDILGKSLGFSVEESIHTGMIVLFCMSMLYGYGYKLLNPMFHQVYICVTLLELGAVLYTLSLVNISMSSLLAVAIVPLAASTGMSSNILVKYIHCFLVLLCHPFILMYVCLLLQSYVIDSNASLKSHFSRAFEGHRKVILFGIEDWHIFGNWNYGLITGVFFPVWLQFWLLDICYNV